MNANQYVERFVDLTRSDRQPILNMSKEEARRRVRSGDTRGIAEIRGHFALADKEDRTVRLARTIGRPLRYMVAKRHDGPYLIVSDRMDCIGHFCDDHGLGDQFHPSYTRMVPAHHLVEIRQIGCPDPNPVYRRFFTPQRNRWAGDLEDLGGRYVEAFYLAVRDFLAWLPNDEPVGVAFSGGTDSTSVVVLALRAMRELGRDPKLLRAFTLSMAGGDADLLQARRVARQFGLEECLEEINVEADAVSAEETVACIEDYHPLDVQCAAMSLAMLAEVRRRHPRIRYLLDGDGADENLKDYPLEGTEITTQSVLNNLMLYQEGWGVDSLKHSLVYSGGHSRSYTRTYAPAQRYGFEVFSPYALPEVIEVAEGIPFAALTDYDPRRLYALKGEIMRKGLRQFADLELPALAKRRFQHGATTATFLAERLPEDKARYRRIFDELWRTTDASALPAKVRSA
jgi:asparagine synthase (glutamine-hydrolysing)